MQMTGGIVVGMSGPSTCGTLSVSVVGGSSRPVDIEVNAASAGTVALCHLEIEEVHVLIDLLNAAVRIAGQGKPHV